jgi:HD-like signal output (HDOD) protein
MAGSVLDAIRSNGIPPCPHVLQVVQDQVASNAPDYHVIAHAIVHDAAIAGGLLHVVNSAYFGLRRRVTNVLDALAVLGTDAIANAVACVSLQRLFGTTHTLEAFWADSASVADLAGEMALRLHLPSLDPAECFTFGLFRDVGIGVMLTRLPNYEAVLATARTDLNRPLVAIEDAMYSTNHATVGYVLAQAWCLPAAIADAIRFHHDLGALSLSEPGSARLVALANLADHIRLLRTGQPSTDSEWERAGLFCQAQLGISEEEISILSQPLPP